MMNFAIAKQPTSLIQITAKTEEEVRHSIQIQIAEWKSKPFYIEGPHTNIQIPMDYFYFDVDATVHQFMTANKRKWYELFSDRYFGSTSLVVALDERIDELLEPYIYLSKESVKEQLVEHASVLKESPLVIEESEAAFQSMKRVAFGMEVIPNDVVQLGDLIDTLDEYTFHEGEVFSLLQFIENEHVTADAHSLSFFASVLNAASLESSLSVLERHAQLEVPNYARPGTDVQIDKITPKDFKIYNVSKHPVVMKIKHSDNRLIVALHSFDEENKYTFNLKEETVPYKTIYRYSSQLKGKQERVLRDGSSGVHVTLFKMQQNGPFEQEERLGETFYAPINKIVEIAPDREEAAEMEREQVEGNEGKESHEIDVDDEGQPLAPEGEKPLTDKAGRPVVQ
ncbi:G5 domain-containing protein [Cerasibacillus sp.]|uniref:G5 domain-containing protein n=1 Tax=Cerasibacillus sp. TaxID=2498711 RepID=UPI002F4062C3